MLSVYDLDKLLKGSSDNIDQEDLVVTRSTVDMKEVDFNYHGPLMFDFDPLHNLLVIAQESYYNIFIGDEPDRGFTQKYNSWMEEPKPKELVFSLAKTSILDNKIVLLAMKNMRLYLVDSEYSMVVFTIAVTE